ncbi:pancreatic lipase-related protein 2-like isoform X1 [Epargyreus clarus]|uniref:pancreatic lipase-related protein 2-like isoform X1 n=1 Tax=Epargyreus clarus TaxID=520877 RepID=UPI003C3072EC
MGLLFTFLISALLCAKVNANWKIKYGPFHTFLYSNWILCDHNKYVQHDVSDIEVFFYDFQNNFNVTYKIDNAVESLTSVYNLDPSKKLIFFVPGYRSHIAKNSPELIRQAFRDVPNIYLIIIDHSVYTTSPTGRWKSYENSVQYTYSIGQALGKFLSDLRNNKGFPSQNIHCIGHSLGSQILGVVGTAYFERTLEKVWRITGIDPAGPCFSNGFIEDQLRSGCADYVEVYHCSAGTLGTTSVLADIDFFFNENGRVQPHCHEGIIPGIGESEAATCSHKSCMIFYTKTVQNPGWYLAWRCDSYKHFAKGKCAGNEMTIAGYSNPGNASGVFYVSTNAYDGL